MSHIYSASVKGLIPDAEYTAKAYGGRVIGVHAVLAQSVTVYVEFLKPKTIYDWFNSSNTNAPPSYGGRQFPASSLLHFRELSAEEITIAYGLRKLDPAFLSHRTSPKRGVTFDLDGLSAFESAKQSTGAYSVSTLVPGLRGLPRYRYFETLAEALAYARQRARSGPRLRLGGKAYYVLGYSVDAPVGASVYRVFRAFRQQEQTRGYAHPEPRREFVAVQRAEGQQEDGKTRWVWDHTQSVEILNEEIEREKKLPQASKPRLKLPGAQ